VPPTLPPALLAVPRVQRILLLSRCALPLPRSPPWRLLVYELGFVLRYEYKKGGEGALTHPLAKIWTSRGW